MSYVIYDCEFTSWEGALAANWPDPTKQPEVIQIGAVRVDDDFNVIASLSFFVKPTENPILSDFIKDLTGIQQHQVDSGCTYTKAIQKLATFASNDKLISHGADHVVLAKEASRKKMPIAKELPAKQFSNIRQQMMSLVAAELGPNANVDCNDPGQYCSGLLPKLLGLNLELPAGSADAEHDALYDAYAIAAALKFFQEKSTALDL